jgi:hypothetical protein
MTIEFTEDIDLGLRKSFQGRVTKRRWFKQGEVHRVEFLGEGPDLESIDFRFDDGLVAMKVPRFVVNVFPILQSE